MTRCRSVQSIRRSILSHRRGRLLPILRGIRVLRPHTRRPRHLIIIPLRRIGHAIRSWSRVLLIHAGIVVGGMRCMCGWRVCRRRCVRLLLVVHGLLLLLGMRRGQELWRRGLRRRHTRHAVSEPSSLLWLPGSGYSDRGWKNECELGSRVWLEGYEGAGRSQGVWCDMIDRPPCAASVEWCWRVSDSGVFRVSRSTTSAAAADRRHGRGIPRPKRAS